MKRFFLFAALLAGFTALAQAQSLPANIQLKLADGQRIVSQELLSDGVPVILTFWTTSCKPCLQELEAINQIYDDKQEEMAFKVVAVSTDNVRSASKVAPLAKARRWPFVVVLDTNEDLKHAMNVTLNPTAFVLDKDGKIVYSHIGYTQGSEEELFKALTNLNKE